MTTKIVQEKIKQGEVEFTNGKDNLKLGFKLGHYTTVFNGEVKAFKNYKKFRMYADTLVTGHSLKIKSN